MMVKAIAWVIVNTWSAVVVFCIAFTVYILSLLAKSMESTYDAIVLIAPYFAVVAAGYFIFSAAIDLIIWAIKKRWKDK